MNYHLTLFLEVIARLLLAMCIGGGVGWERARSHHPAGMRTHMLVTIGAAIVMLLGSKTTGEFAGTANSDPARLGAQVISGIGFLGAGTIMKGPVITDDTIFSSGRLNVVSFDRHFEPHEQDKHLKDKLRRKDAIS